MKKIFLSLIFSIGILFSMSSCISSTYAQDVIVEDDGVGVSMGVVVRYGTPYYFEGSILYYLYNGWYYYPYLTGNGYYLYRYSRPLPPPRHGYRFEPRPGDRPHITHRPYGSMRSSTRHVERQPAVRGERPQTRPRGFGNQPRTNPQPQQRGNVSRPATPQVRNNGGGNISRPAPQVRGGGSAPSSRGGAPSSGGRGGFGGRR